MRMPAARPARAFSLIEVMIALAIFFTASFVILAIVSAGLRTARMLRTTRPSAAILASQDTLTNALEEGVESGDFGNLYPDYNWKKDTYEKPDDTNGLWQIDYVIYKRGHGNAPESTLSIWRYSPGSKSKRLGLQP